MNYQAKVVGTALGWLKSVASSVLRLFNLTGPSLFPLKWFMEHWIVLLSALLIIGVAGDIIVWLFRWRPHWAWFRLKRIIVNDPSILEETDLSEEDLFADNNQLRARHRTFIASSRGEKAPAQMRRTKPHKSKPKKPNPQPVVEMFEVGNAPHSEKKKNPFDIPLPSESDSDAQ